jgi:hypothetical protein
MRPSAECGVRSAEFRWESYNAHAMFTVKEVEYRDSKVLPDIDLEPLA